MCKTLLVLVVNSPLFLCLVAIASVIQCQCLSRVGRLRRGIDEQYNSGRWASRCTSRIFCAFLLSDRIANSMDSTLVPLSAATRGTDSASLPC